MTTNATCIIPAKDEAETIGDVIDVVKQVQEISEIIVVDDGSSDETSDIARKRKVKVVRHAVNRGKGAAIKSGAQKAKNDLLVFVDADLQNISPGKVQKIVAPLLKNEADFVKASYKTASGRTTKLVAKPLLKILYPFVDLEQPLSGEFGLHKKKFDLENIEDGWGVDIQLVLQAAQKKLRIKEVFLGRKEHKHHDLDALSKQAEEVMRTVLSELKLIAHTYKIVFFDLDRTLIDASSIEVFAEAWGFSNELHRLQQEVKAGQIPDKEITKALARHFTGKRQHEVNAVCRTISTTPFAAEVIRQLRAQRYRVRIVSAAYSPVVKYFAAQMGIHDFVCPRINRDVHGHYTGKLRASRFEDVQCTCCGMYVCKKKAVDYVRKRFGWKHEECMGIGDGKSDQCMFRACGRSLGYKNDMGNIRIESLPEVLIHVD